MPGIRTRLEVVNDPLLDIESFYADFARITFDIAEQVFKRVEPLVYQEVRHVPPPAKHPFEFGTPKSRRYYMRAVRDGRIRTVNGRYQRTGKLPEGWKFRVVKTEAGATFTLAHGALAAKWVYGSFDARRRYQVAGHQNTGWVPIRDTADFVLDLVYEEYVREFNQVIPREYGRTRGRRRNR